MNEIIAKAYRPSLSNVFVWLNALFLIILLVVNQADALTVIMAYFLETIIVGVLHAVKMFMTIKFYRTGGYKFILFFFMHYMFFVVVQLIFVFAFLQIKDFNITKPYNLYDNISYVLTLKGMEYVLSSIVIYNVADFIINFVISKAFMSASIGKIFIQPYPRVLVQQLAVILTTFFFLLLPGVLALAVFLVVIRTWLELSFVSKARKNTRSDLNRI